MKKFITMGLLAAVCIGIGAPAFAEPAGPAGVDQPEKEGISIADGFLKLWRETGIYRFANPQTQEEKDEAYRAALIKTVQAEIAAGHFDGVYDVIEEAEIHGVDEGIIAGLKE